MGWDATLALSLLAGCDFHQDSTGHSSGESEPGLPALQGPTMRNTFIVGVYKVKLTNGDNTTFVPPLDGRPVPSQDVIKITLP